MYRSLRHSFVTVSAAAVVASTTVAQDVQPPSSPALETINRILEADQEALELGPLGYAADGRRDPFRSLLTRPSVEPNRGPRPPGVPGLLIDDVRVTGVFVTPQGGVAQIQASDKATSYLVRKGDRLYDGEVLDIRYQKNRTAEVVFMQGVRDPVAVKPFREVVKKIGP